MESKEKKSRILGLAFLIQFATSFTSGIFIGPAATGVKAFAESLGIGQIMANLAANQGLARLHILMELVTAAGVIFLGAVLYSALKKEHEGLALTAFGLYVMEGVLIAVSELALFLLLVLGRRYVAEGGPASLEPMAELLYNAKEYAFKLANFSFCPGGTIFYALLFKARTVARPLSLWGLISAQGVFAGLVLGLLGQDAPVFLYVAYIPFELAIAVWILVKGVRNERIPG